MTVVVLAKVVPELERLRFHPGLRVMRREEAPLLVNPLDQRALAAARALRQGDEPVVVVSMAPPAGHRALSELYAHGAARVVAITDDVLAGSDSWVSSIVLAKALQRLSADLVVTGRASTDSSTGQLPAQLAEMLGLPLLSDVRRVIRRSEDLLEVLCETEAGWARRICRPPAVISVSERISKPAKPSPPELSAAATRPLERLDVAGLGLSREEVGLSASPTQVVALQDERPHRSPLVLEEGDISERIERAAARIRENLRPTLPTSRSGPLPPLPARREDPGEVGVFCSDGSGGVAPESLALLSEVRWTGHRLWPTAIGYGPLGEADRTRLIDAGAARIVWKRAPAGWRSAEAIVPLLEGFLSEQRALRGLLFLSTGWGRELAGRLSARRKLGLVGDALGWRSESSDMLIFRKPSFGGGLIAEVVSRTLPELATVRPGALAPGGIPQIAPAPALRDVPVEDLPGPLLEGRVRQEEAGREMDERFGELDSARVVVIVGMGLGGPEHLPALQRAVAPLRAAIGASRRVVDAGWLPSQLQVGLTGKFIAPDLCIEVGISGKDNHTVALQRARVLVGINPKRDEPLFSKVDVGLVGRWEELLDPLARALAPRLQPLPSEGSAALGERPPL